MTGIDALIARVHELRDGAGVDGYGETTVVVPVATIDEIASALHELRSYIAEFDAEDLDDGEDWEVEDEDDDDDE